MNEFNPKTVVIKSETALALIQQREKTVSQYSLYIGSNSHYDQSVTIFWC
jgi:hypothetical protein